MPHWDLTIADHKEGLIHQNNLRTSIRDVSRSHNSTDLFHTLQIWAQASVHGEYLFIDDGCDRQAVEAICKSLPQFDIISSLAYAQLAILTHIRRKIHKFD